MVRVFANDALRLTLLAATAEMGLPQEVVLLEWGSPGSAEDLDRLLPTGAAVVAICSSQQAVVESLDAGASDAVHWPVSSSLLQRRIAMACRRARQPFYDAMQHFTADSVEFTTPEAVLLDVNPAFESITGYDRDKAIGNTPAALFRSEAQQASYYAQIGEGLRTQGFWEGQLAARRQDGSLSFQQATIASVRDEHGREVGHLAIKRDVSRDNLAQSALHGAEQRMQVLFQRAGEAVLVHTIGGGLIDLNPSATQMLGLSRAELLDTTVHDIYVENPDAILEHWRSLSDEPVTIRNRWRRADGSEFPVELSVARTRLVGSEFVLVLARDITIRDRAERELQQLADHLEETVKTRTAELSRALARQRAILDSLADGLVATDADGVVQLINPRLLELLDVHGHFQGAPIASLDPELADMATSCIREEQRCTRELPLPSGFAEVVGTPVFGRRDGSFQCLGTVLVVRDVTLAREVDQMKTDFIATVSHELRTPLTSVLGFAKLARSRLERITHHVPDDDERATKAVNQVRTNLDIIGAEGTRLTALINDVLDISKIESGRVEWASEVIQPDELVGSVLEVTRGLFLQGGPTLVHDVPSGLPSLNGDRHRLMQVLINLVSNAAKFTLQGDVKVAVRLTEEGVEFSVRDSGVGIPHDDLETIFEKFKQSSARQGEKPRGTGLGLPISKAIVDHHGGELKVDSTLGAGSRFWFTLPVNQPHQDPDEPLHRLLHQIDRLHHHGPAHILVVDDDPSVRELMRQLLEEEGHHVRLAENGRQAIDAARSFPTDLVVLDVVMPGLSGFDVAAVLRSDPRTTKIPILVVSIVADETHGLRLGVDRYLPKPVDADELFSAIYSLLHPDHKPRKVIVCSNDEDQASAVSEHLSDMGDTVVGQCEYGGCAAMAANTDPDFIVIIGAQPTALAELQQHPAIRSARVLALTDT